MVRSQNALTGEQVKILTRIASVHKQKMNAPTIQIAIRIPHEDPKTFLYWTRILYLINVRERL
jgi:hypothetical protein